MEDMFCTIRHDDFEKTFGACDINVRRMQLFELEFVEGTTDSGPTGKRDMRGIWQLIE